MGKQYNCLIADDHPIVRRGIRDLLAHEIDCSKIGEEPSAVGALAAIRREPWDLLILDLALPDQHGLEVLKEAKVLRPKLAVLMLSLYPEQDFAMRAMKAGASGYLTKDRPPAELLRAVKEVLAGRRYMSQSLAEMMAASSNEKQADAPHVLLSDREMEVLRLLGQGNTVSAIAKRLNLSVKTISTYRTRLLDKLNLRTTADLVRYGIEHHLTA